MSRSPAGGSNGRGTAPSPLRTLRDSGARDADQTAAEPDQTAADADQTAAETDQTAADTDQTASDLDQASSDTDQREEHDRTSASDDRSAAARLRDIVATQRDEVAFERDARATARDAAIERVDTPAGRAMERMRLRAAADREDAARDRARAAADREIAAEAREAAARDREVAARDLVSIQAVRAEVAAQLKRAHLDDLTGAYRRDMGRLALSHEIDRARRGDGRFVLCFIDLDHLKVINDRHGHPAGDRALIAVVAAVRSNLRSFDPILRYGGDEFIAGLGGTDLAGAEERLRTIQATLGRRSGLHVSVGFAELEPADTVDDLIERADRDLYRRRSETEHETRSG
jgi:diguanylate cyclase (GGDEF)-like protein